MKGSGRIHTKWFLRRIAKRYSRIWRKDLVKFWQQIFAYVVVGEVEKSMVPITRVCQRVGCQQALSRPEERRQLQRQSGT
ncbi:hypothetical protein GGE07_005193 [Sinorhizobium terangae]|nr:hypothetical protein [Sinorhizobium terangae]